MDLGLRTSDIKEKMVFGTIFQRVLDEAKEVVKKKERSPYWVVCPACGRRVVGRELIAKGCYVCAWQETETELKEAETKSLGEQESRNLYRTNCPNCEAKVIKQQLQEKGCYVCGWRP